MAHVTTSHAAGLPALRRLPTPHTEPPFDDELVRSALVGGSAVPVTRDVIVAGAVQGTLALAFVLPSGLPASPATPRLRLLTGSCPDREELATVAEPRAELPDPRAWAGRLVQALVEVLAGERPVAQLVRWTDSGVYAQVIRCAGTSARDSAHTPPARPGSDSPRASVKSVRVMEPKDGVAEVCALVQRGLRTTAVALRLEGADGRWKCTALELG